MANHSITVKLAANELRNLMNQIKALRQATNDFANAVDRLGTKLDKNLTTIRTLLSNTPKLKVANVSGSGAGGGTGVGKPKVAPPDGSKQFIGPLQQNLVKPAPVVPPPILSSWKTTFADAMKDVGRGNVSGAGGKLASFLSSGNGPTAKLAKLSMGATALGSAIGLLLAPLLAVAAGVVGFGVAIGKTVAAIGEMVVSMKQFSLYTSNSATNKGKVEALANSLGLDKQKVAQDQTRYGDPAAFWSMLESIRKANSETHAILMARSMGLEEYAGVYSMSDAAYNRMQGAQKNEPQGTNALFGFLGEIIHELVADFNYLKEQGIKGLVLAMSGIITALALGAKLLRGLFEGLAWIQNQLIDFAKKLGFSFDKVDKAADKLKDAADAQLRAAGMYGPGQRAAKSLEGVGDFRGTRDAAALEGTLKRLGAI